MVIVIYIYPYFKSMGYIMLEYEHTEDLIYFNKAEGIKQSQMKYYNKNEMTLYDYTNANRIQVLIHFIC